jgi:hypothetical protein
MAQGAAITGRFPMKHFFEMIEHSFPHIATTNTHEVSFEHFPARSAASSP